MLVVCYTVYMVLIYILRCKKQNIRSCLVVSDKDHKGKRGTQIKNFT